MTKASRWWSPNTWSGCGSKCKTPFAVVSISGNATDDRGWKGVKVSRWWSATPDLDTRQCRSSCKEQCRAVWNIQHSSVGFAIRFTGNVMQYSALSFLWKCLWRADGGERVSKCNVDGAFAEQQKPCTALHSSSLVLRRSGEDESPVHQLHFHRCQVEKIQEASKATWKISN